MKVNDMFKKKHDLLSRWNVFIYKRKNTLTNKFTATRPKLEFTEPHNPLKFLKNCSNKKKTLQ